MVVVADIVRRLLADADGPVLVIAVELGEAPNDFLVCRCDGEVVSPVVGDLVQVFLGVEVVAVVVATVEMVELAIHFPQRLAVNGGALAWRSHAQVDLARRNSSNRLLSGTAQKNGAGDATGSAAHRAVTGRLL